MKNYKDVFLPNQGPSWTGHSSPSPSQACVLFSWEGKGYAISIYGDIIFFYYHLYFKNLSSICMCEITPTTWMKRKQTYVFSCWFSLSNIIYIAWSNTVVHVMLLFLQWHIFSLSKLIFILSLWMQLLHLIFSIKKKCLLIFIVRRRVMNIC